MRPGRRPAATALPLALLLLAAAPAAPAAREEPPAAAPAAQDPAPQEKLWDAARQGDAAAVKALLDAGVDPDAEFREGGTALLFAAQRGHAEVVELLLDRGADVHAKDRLNDTSVLHFGIRYPEVVRLLLAHGADVNARDAQAYQTPLWWVMARKAPAESARLLVASGRVSARGLKDALAFAERLEQTEIAGAIRAALARADTVPRWPQFRGARAAGVADGEGPPLEWDAAAEEAPVNVRWKTPIPGLGHSSPVVWGDRIFVTTAVSENPKTDLRPGSPMESAADMSRHAMKVYALDRHTGKVLWERTAWEGVPRTRRSPKNSFASPTPATDGRHLVAMFGSHGLYCYDLDGTLLWQQDLGVLDTGFFFDPGYQWADASSPVIYKDTVILQVDVQKGSYLAAFALKDGKERWRTAREELPSWGSPTVHEGPGRTEIVTNGVKQVRGYDPDTGKELWHLTTGNSYISGPTPVVGPDLFVVGNGYRPLRPLYAIRPGANGDISLGDAAANASVLWSKKSGGPYYITPLLYRDLLYVVAEPGLLTVYYPKTGEEVYRQRIGDTGAAFSASPVAADGYLFLASEDGNVYVARAGIEYRLDAVNPVGELMMATPAIVDGALYLRTRHHLVAIAADPEPEPEPAAQ